MYLYCPKCLPDAPKGLQAPDPFYWIPNGATQGRGASGKFETATDDTFTIIICVGVPGTRGFLMVSKNKKYAAAVKRYERELAKFRKGAR